MKSLIFLAAVAVCTAASAEPQSLTIHAPGQPLADQAATEGAMQATAFDRFKPIARNSYQLCSPSILDNCVQARDPGGSEVALAIKEGTIFPLGTQLANANTPKFVGYTGMGGPEFEVDASEYMPSAIGVQPFEREAYPPCSATVTDNCQQ